MSCCWFIMLTSYSNVDAVTLVSQLTLFRWIVSEIFNCFQDKFFFFINLRTGQVVCHEFIDYNILLTNKPFGNFALYCHNVCCLRDFVYAS